MSHTLGPWRLAATPDERDLWWGQFDIPAECVVVGWAGIPVCATNDDGAATEEDVANAHLVAAAPDLLEALKAYLRVPTMAYVTGNYEYERPFREAAEKAIAKAEGK